MTTSLKLCALACAICALPSRAGFAVPGSSRADTVGFTITTANTLSSHAAPDDNGPKRIKVGDAVLKLGMSVDDVSTELGKDWEDPVQLEKSGDETLYRWRRHGTKAGNHHRKAQTGITGQVRCKFADGKLVQVIIDQI